MLKLRYIAIPLLVNILIAIAATYLHLQTPFFVSYVIAYGLAYFTNLLPERHQRSNGLISLTLCLAVLAFFTALQYLDQGEFRSLYGFFTAGSTLGLLLGAAFTGKTDS